LWSSAAERIAAWVSAGPQKEPSFQKAPPVSKPMSCIGCHIAFDPRQTWSVELQATRDRYNMLESGTTIQMLESPTIAALHSFFIESGRSQLLSMAGGLDVIPDGDLGVARQQIIDDTANRLTARIVQHQDVNGGDLDSAIASATGPQMVFADLTGLTELYEWNDELDYFEVRKLEGVELHQRGLIGLSKFTGSVAFVGGTASSLQAGYTPGTVANEFSQIRTWATTFKHGTNTYRFIGEAAEIQPTPYLVTPMEAAAPFDATLEQLTMANRYQQILNRGGSTGTATVFQHPGQPLHVSIDVTHGATSLQTHQVIFSIDKTMTRIVSATDVPAGSVVRSASVELPSAAAAMARQQELMAIPNLGSYDVIENSCVSHVCEFLTSGGELAPQQHGSAQLRFLLNILKEKK
jgi:hypothetical protein